MHGTPSHDQLVHAVACSMGVSSMGLDGLGVSGAGVFRLNERNYLLDCSAGSGPVSVSYPLSRGCACICRLDGIGLVGCNRRVVEVE